MTAARLAAWTRHNGWVVNLVFIALGAYFVAGAVSSVMARAIRIVPSLDDMPAAPAGRAQSAAAYAASTFTAMAARNLFAAKREDLNPVLSAPVEETPAMASGAIPDDSQLRTCTIGGTVRATLVAEGAPEWSLAVIFNNNDRETSVHSINEGSSQISDDAWLADVRHRSIVVRRRDHYELCHCEGEGGAPTSSMPLASSEPPPMAGEESTGGGEGVNKINESDYHVERRIVDDALSNLSDVATKARIVPSFKNGKPNGFKMFSIKPGSIFAKIGLQNGDVIKKINGYEINSPDKALELYQKLKDTSSVSLDVERRGQSKSFNYVIR